MPANASESCKTSVPNCGLWRERGTVRTSITCATSFCCSNATNASMGRVARPIVQATPGSGVDSARRPDRRGLFARGDILQSRHHAGYHAVATHAGEFEQITFRDVDIARKRLPQQAACTKETAAHRGFGYVEQ